MSKKKLFTIKTIDGNRYESDKIPLRTEIYGIDWLYFPVREGVDTKYINIANIVSMTEQEVEE